MLKCSALRLCCALFFVLTLATAAWAVRAVTAQEAVSLLQSPPDGLVVLDVRTPEEFAAGHLNNARNVDFFGPRFEQDLLPMDRKKPYLVYCRTGIRSEKAAEMMESMGFADVRHVEGGINALQSAGAAVQK